MFLASTGAPLLFLLRRGDLCAVLRPGRGRAGRGRPRHGGRSNPRLQGGRTGRIRPGVDSPAVGPRGLSRGGGPDGGRGKRALRHDHKVDYLYLLSWGNL